MKQQETTIAGLDGLLTKKELQEQEFRHTLNQERGQIAQLDATLKDHRIEAEGLRNTLQRRDEELNAHHHFPWMESLVNLLSDPQQNISPWVFSKEVGSAYF